jgi:Fic family protein
MTPSSLTRLDPGRFDTAVILKKLNAATRQLAELKGVAGTIPNQGILINTLSMREAKDSSEIENIVTTHDELFQQELELTGAGPAAAKEVLRYREALRVGYEGLLGSGLLTVNHIRKIQEALEHNQAGFRKLPGTHLKNPAGEIVYTPPQDFREITSLMADLEQFINVSELFDTDPLIKMALIHHQFESIHPFYDGNGRTGRIINILYLMKEGLLEIPVLYLSRYIMRTKTDYYRLLQAVRTQDAWEDWVLYILEGVRETATEGVLAIQHIRQALFDVKDRIRQTHSFYSQDLINNLFTHPYTRINSVAQDLEITRSTATKYLEELVKDGLLRKQ